MNIVNLIAFGVASLVIAGLIIVAIILGFKSRKYYRESVQLSMDKVVLLVQLEKLTETRDVKSIEETQGFIKFLSESRESAFDYIEDVQQALTAYDIALNTDDAKIINDAYKKLISFLPDDMVK